jgi:predicted Zn finger-like uncharacterized protein
MDVTCDNCKAEYDFDDTLLGDKGTTVKCSKCGHVFRVLPPRREPQRSALKVRFRDGHVESVASLRELQQRIQAGTVGMDDELGRDGFTFRRLGDVPELKNFFVRPGPSSGSVPNAGTPTPAPLPHRGEPLPGPKRTMLGVGKVEVPAAPRVPNLGPVAAQALAPTQPAAAHPKHTVQGRAPISSAPTAPNMAIPPREPERREAPSQRVPISSAPTPSGTAPTMPASPSMLADGAAGMAATVIGPSAVAHAAGGARPAAQAAQPSVPSFSQPAPAQRPAGPSLRIPDSVSDAPTRQGPLSGRAQAMGADSIAPGVLKAALGAPHGGGPSSGAPARPSNGAGVRLSLDEDESRRPDGRSSGSSKVWIYALGILALGGAGWAIAGQLAPGPAPVSTPTPVTPTPAPAAAPALVDASAPAAAAEPASAPAPTAADAVKANAAAPEPAPVAEAPKPDIKPEAKPEPKGEAKPEPKSEAKPGATSASPEPAGREPKDYAGWVGRGDQLLKKGDMAGAQQAFEQAVALRGTGSEANSGLGAVLLAQGQTKEAIPYLTRAANNGFAEASVGLGDAHRKLGQKDAAIEAYETYLARLPRGARASYVKLQLEGLGRDVGGGAKAAPSEPAAAPSGGGEYRPAGELTEPAAEPKPPESAP